MIHQKEKLMLIFSILLKKHMYLPGRLVDTPQNLVSSLNLPGRLVDHPLHCSGGSSKIQVDKVDPGKKPMSSLNLPGRFVDPPQNLVSSLYLPGRLVDHPLHCSGGSSKIQVD